MNSNPPGKQTAPREACKLLTCLVPHDGTDKKLMRSLRDEKQITRANRISCLNMELLANVRIKFSELPEPTMMSQVEIVVPEDNADDLYDYIYEKACIGKPQGGIIWMESLALTSPFPLPEDLPAEKS